MASLPLLEQICLRHIAVEENSTIYVPKNIKRCVLGMGRCGRGCRIFARQAENLECLVLEAGLSGMLPVFGVGWRVLENVREFKREFLGKNLTRRGLVLNGGLEVLKVRFFHCQRVNGGNFQRLRELEVIGMELKVDYVMELVNCLPNLKHLEYVSAWFDINRVDSSDLSQRCDDFFEPVSRIVGLKNFAIILNRDQDSTFAHIFVQKLICMVKDSPTITHVFGAPLAQLLSDIVTEKDIYIKIPGWDRTARDNAYELVMLILECFTDRLLKASALQITYSDMEKDPFSFTPIRLDLKNVCQDHQEMKLLDSLGLQEYIKLRGQTLISRHFDLSLCRELH